MFTQDLCMIVHSSFIHNSLKLEKNSMPINWCRYKLWYICTMEYHSVVSKEQKIYGKWKKLDMNEYILYNLDSIFKSRDITLPTKVHLVKALVFPVVMYGYESWRKLSTEELMLLNCGVGEDSWESLGEQGDPTSPFWRRSVLGVHWKDWC